MISSFHIVYRRPSKRNSVNFSQQMRTAQSYNAVLTVHLTEAVLLPECNKANAELKDTEHNGC